MTSSLYPCGALRVARFPLLLATAALLAATTAPAQRNVRELGITLGARPFGSAPGTPYTTVLVVGTPNFAVSYAGQPGSQPFPPFAASGLHQLVTNQEYQVDLQVHVASTPDYATDASIGQRFDVQLSANFGAAAAVTMTSISHTHRTDAGYLNSWWLQWDSYFGSGSVLPWQDSSSVAQDGQAAEGATSVLFLPTSASAKALTLLASGEVNAQQSAPPPFSAFAFGYVWPQSTVEFRVTQPMALNLNVASSGQVRGESQHFPLLPVLPPNGFSGPSGAWYDPPLALGFDFQQSGSSLFTDILSLPVGIDGDGMFGVEVGGQSLGQFAAGSRVDFRQILGGNGVASFRIVGIDPAVDATDAAVFPVQLAFDTPTADFTMTPVLWRKVGSTCADTAVCAQCPALSLEPIGAALEGNLGFGLGITDGPANGIAGLFVGIGTASPTPLPLFCGSVVLPLQNGVIDIGATVLAGSSGCTGASSVPLPLHPQAGLLGLFLTVQAVTICPAGGFGLSHGIEFAIGN